MSAKASDESVLPLPVGAVSVKRPGCFRRLSSNPPATAGAAHSPSRWQVWNSNPAARFPRAVCCLHPQPYARRTSSSVQASIPRVLRLIEPHFQESRDDVILGRARSGAVAERPDLVEGVAVELDGRAYLAAGRAHFHGFPAQDRLKDTLGGAERGRDSGPDSTPHPALSPIEAERELRGRRDVGDGIGHGVWARPEGDGTGDLKLEGIRFHFN